ncbi:MAG: hypothetical protein Q8K72_01045, partial [Acidimicrobiales bacterium]|nr:hypothetical protein [Acidimicrobiales bacterium]
MRRLLLLLALLLLAPASPAAAQVTPLDAAASALRNNPVYVDGSAELASDIDADRLRALIRSGESPIFVAVLPASVGDANQMPTELANKVGLRGTYAVVTGRSFRAGSNVLPAGQAGTLATASFQARSERGVGAVVETFVDRVNDAASGQSAGGGTASGGDSRESSGSGSGGVLLLLFLIAGGGFFFWSRSTSKARR